MLVDTVIAWYFVIWSISGMRFATIGPFGEESICDTIRTEMKKDIGDMNQFSKCWKGPSTLKDTIY